MKKQKEKITFISEEQLSLLIDENEKIIFSEKCTSCGEEADEIIVISRFESLCSECFEENQTNGTIQFFTWENGERCICCEKIEIDFVRICKDVKICETCYEKLTGFPIF